MTQELEQRVCEQCGLPPTGQQSFYYIDNTRICHKCYHAIKRKPRYDKICRLPFTIPSLRPKELVEAEIRYKEYDKEYEKRTQPRRNMLKRKRHALWPNQKLLLYNDPIVIASEEYVANNILPKLGYTKIMITRYYNDKFWCDILAKKPNGPVHAFDAKLGHYTCMKEKKFDIVEFMEIPYYVVHIREDYTYYYIVQIIVNGRRSSSAYGPYMEFLKQQKTPNA